LPHRLIIVAMIVACGLLVSLGGCAEEPVLQTYVKEVRSEAGVLQARRFLTDDPRLGTVPHGVQTEYYDNGLPRQQTHCVLGKKEGLQTEWYPDETKSLEGTWKADQRTGPWTAWQPTGQVLWRATYAAGVIRGTKVFYLSDRVVMEETYGDAGELVKLVKYHDNGQKALEGSYALGEKNGTWVEWDKTGAVVANGEWKEGKPWSGKLAIPVPGDAGSLGGRTVFREFRDGREITD
jgi:antitoxin component YwqK of YwqJK toxin-antitoxin module